MSTKTETKPVKYNFHYCGNVKKKIKKAVKNTVTDLYNSTTKNKSFFSDFNIYLCKNTKKLPNNSNLLMTAKVDDGFIGLSKAKEFNGAQKDIILRTATPSKVLPGEIKPSMAKHVVLHEMGHHFDYTFNKKDPELTPKIEKFFNNEAVLSDDEYETYKILNEYTRSKDLSDTPEFKEAWRKDVNALLQKDHLYERFKELGEFSPFYHYSKYANIPDLTQGLGQHETEAADEARAEEMAELFSYALMPEDAMNEVDFRIIKTYKNCYGVVKKYINEHLGVKCHEYEYLVNVAENNYKKGHFIKNIKRIYGNAKHHIKNLLEKIKNTRADKS